MQDPDFLILDEPANHLDYEGVAWLEDFINRFKGCGADRVAQSVSARPCGQWHPGSQRRAGGNITTAVISTYRATRLRDLLAQQSDYIANQKRLAQLEALVKRFEQIARANSDPAWGKRLRARRTQLEREKKNAVEQPILGPDKIQAAFTTEASHASIALQLRGYSKAYGTQTLLQEVRPRYQLR